jgi:hypothetical protein
MNDLLWYTRLLVWVGCGALLVEAVSGRSFGYLTVVAVIFLVVGLAGFVAGLALQGRSLSWLLAVAEAPPAAITESAPRDRYPGTALSRGEDALTEDVAVTQAESEPRQVGGENVAVADGLETSGDRSSSPEPRRAEALSYGGGNAPKPPRAEALSYGGEDPGRARRIRTEELSDGSPAAGGICPHCGSKLRSGQIGMVCWACGAAHHAGCWTENRFRCATPGCRGAGSLEAPELTAAEIQDE